jgi:hypothetical protein
VKLFQGEEQRGKKQGSKKKKEKMYTPGSKEGWCTEVSALENAYVRIR